MGHFKSNVKRKNSSIRKKVFYSIWEILREYMPNYYKQQREKLQKEIEEMEKKYAPNC